LNNAREEVHRRRAEEAGDEEVTRAGVEFDWRPCLLDLIATVT
jgi:hypothetical protein